MPSRPLTFEDVKARTILGPGGCWLWQLHCDKDGYGVMSRKHRPHRVHRVAYEMAKGAIPDGMEMDHLCRVRRCCNPDHLEAVTYRENQMRGRTLMAINLAKTHCAQGHPFSGRNLYIDPKRGWRGCRTCRSAATRRRDEKRRA